MLLHDSSNLTNIFSYFRRTPAIVHEDGVMFLFHSLMNHNRQTGVEKWTWVSESSNDWTASVPFTTTLLSELGFNINDKLLNGLFYVKNLKKPINRVILTINQLLPKDSFET